jgi:hypothetical protein
MADQIPRRSWLAIVGGQILARLSTIALYAFEQTHGSASCDQRPWELKFKDIFAQLSDHLTDDGGAAWHLIALKYLATR